MKILLQFNLCKLQNLSVASWRISLIWTISFLIINLLENVFIFSPTSFRQSLLYLLRFILETQKMMTLKISFLMSSIKLLKSLCLSQNLRNLKGSYTFLWFPLIEITKEHDLILFLTNVQPKIALSLLKYINLLSVARVIPFQLELLPWFPSKSTSESFSIISYCICSCPSSFIAIIWVSLLPLTHLLLFFVLLCHSIKKVKMM